MPEYLSPGVYVEETSFRSKSIEGVSTSTAGFVGPTRFGPVYGDPVLITNQADFERYYGGLDDLAFTDRGQMPNYLAHAVRAFFEEGGQRLYVSRVFNFGDGVTAVPIDGEGIPTAHYAHFSSSDVPNVGSPPAGTQPITVMARFPGVAGKMRVTFTLRVGANAFNVSPKAGSDPKSTKAADKVFNLTQIQSFTLVHIGTLQTNPTRGWKSLAGGTADGLYLAYWDAVQQSWQLIGDGYTFSLVDLYNMSNPGSPTPDKIQVRPVTVLVEVAYPTVTPQGVSGFGASTLLGEFGFDPRSSNGLTNNFTRNPATHEQALTVPFSLENAVPAGTDADQVALDIARELLGEKVLNTLTNFTNAPDDIRAVYPLGGGDDGALPIGINYEGIPFDFPDLLDNPIQSPKNGLLAFESVEDISIVAAPGYSANPNATDVFAIQSAVIDHCEKMRYRIAVLDTPHNMLVTDALEYRNLRSSKYAALYYPWITVANPLRDERLDLPPSGFVAGIYARNDNEHAVFKAPANEVVRLAVDFEQRLNKGQQDVLNPAGVNCFRFFPGHGFLLWGARTISDDPEWKYVNLRRYFAYLEHSIDRGTQWVVFENNSRLLWDNVRHTIEDFLLNEWKMGGLIGDKPEQAYFVRCDMTTMTQNDLDNGRLVCLIGVAPVRPAEFVIFRIGQWTATSKVS